MSIAAAKTTLAKRIRGEKIIFAVAGLNALSGCLFHDIRWAVAWVFVMFTLRLLYSQVRIVDKVAEAKAQIDALEVALRGPRR